MKSVDELEISMTLAERIWSFFIWNKNMAQESVWQAINFGSGFVSFTDDINTIGKRL